MTDRERKEVKAEAFEEAAQLVQKLGGDEYLVEMVRALAEKQEGLIVLTGKTPSDPKDHGA